MNQKLFYKLLFTFNHLYKWCYPLYLPMYEIYKYITDRKDIALIKKELRSDAIVLDIGSNIGYYSKFFSSLVPNGHVYSFEPEKCNYAKLKKRLKNYKNVTSINMAVGAKSEKINIYISEKLNVDHRTYSAPELLSTKSRKFESIDCISIDDFFSGEKIINNLFIKIDIQGYDFFAIKGAKKIISQSKNITIFGEFWPYGLKQSGIDPNEYISLLEELGFQLLFKYDKSELIKNIDNETFYTDFWGKIRRDE